MLWLVIEYDNSGSNNLFKLYKFDSQSDGIKFILENVKSDITEMAIEFGMDAGMANAKVREFLEKGGVLWKYTWDRKCEGYYMRCTQFTNNFEIEFDNDEMIEMSRSVYKILQ